ncbi:hypothetical protein JXA47_14880 [Candidatus Sumerlaeota bacterium]|nr:hypothetical protein [Candidatus Sumerlaeota bacterium]
MIGRALWLLLLVAAAIAGWHWLYQSRPATSPHSSPRSAMIELCRGIEADNPPLMSSICIGEAVDQVDDIRAELDARAERGLAVTTAWVDGNTSAHGDHAQGLIWIMDSTGNRLPRWDVYAVRDDQGRWWIERLTDR